MSWSSSSGDGIIGVVVRDAEGAEGRFVAVGKWKTHALNAAEAEANAILTGYELAKSLNLQDIVVESDSKVNISCLLNDISYGCWEAFPSLSKIVRLKEAFQRCCWSWVPRSANLVADRLVSRFNTEMYGSSWVNQPPSSLVHVLNKDGLPCPP